MASSKGVVEALALRPRERRSATFRSVPLVSQHGLDHEARDAGRVASSEGIGKALALSLRERRTEMLRSVPLMLQHELDHEERNARHGTVAAVKLTAEGMGEVPAKNTLAAVRAPPGSHASPYCSSALARRSRLFAARLMRHGQGWYERCACSMRRHLTVPELF